MSAIWDIVLHLFEWELNSQVCFLHRKRNRFLKNDKYDILIIAE